MTQKLKSWWAICTSTKATTVW